MVTPFVTLSDTIKHDFECQQIFVRAVFQNSSVARR